MVHQHADTRSCGTAKSGLGIAAPAGILTTSSPLLFRGMAYVGLNPLYTHG